MLAGLMVGSSAFAASRAGGPLYDARLSLEALTLPSDPSTRLDAELARAQTRITEIADAASRGDDGAVNAAVRAYASTLTDLDAETGTSAGRARDAVLLHQAVLRGLLLRVPTQAQAGIERAISNSTVAIDHLDQAVAPARHAGRRRRRERQRRWRQPQRRWRWRQSQRRWRERRRRGWDVQRRRDLERRWQPGHRWRERQRWQPGHRWRERQRWQPERRWRE